jgi:hypothetical protein
MPKQNIRELRAEILSESKKFCRILEQNSNQIIGELKSQMLEEMRVKLKALLRLIDQLEKEDKSVRERR